MDNSEGSLLTYSSESSNLEDNSKDECVVSSFSRPQLYILISALLSMTLTMGITCALVVSSTLDELPSHRRPQRNPPAVAPAVEPSIVIKNALYNICRAPEFPGLGSDEDWCYRNPDFHYGLAPEDFLEFSHAAMASSLRLY